PGAPTTASKEQNAANVAAGKQRLQLASLIQFALPGAPTVYYGDEVGVTGADDPDDRRTYPWADLGGSPDTSLFGHYQTLAGLLRATGTIDLTPPAAPSGLHVTGEDNGQVALAWNSVAGAAAYNVYRSPVSGGGWVKANAAPVSGTSFTDSGLRNATNYYFTV